MSLPWNVPECHRFKKSNLETIWVIFQTLCIIAKSKLSIAFFMEIRKEIGIIATALKQSKNAVIRYFGSGNRILYNQWKLVVTI